MHPNAAPVVRETQDAAKAEKRSLFHSSRTEISLRYLRSSDLKCPTADVIQGFEVVREVSTPSLPIRNVTMLMLQLELLK